MQAIQVQLSAAIDEADISTNAWSTHAAGEELGCPSRMQVKGAVEFMAVAAQQHRQGKCA